MTALASGPARASSSRRPGRGRVGRGATLTRMLPLIPAIGLLLLFLGGPIVWAFNGSFTNTSLTGPHALNPENIGTANYERLFSDPDLAIAIGVTVAFVVGSAVIGQNVLGLILAVLFRSSNKVISGAVNIFVVTAWVLPEIVAAFISYAFLSSEGTLNGILGIVGIDAPNWLYVMPLLAIILANTWRGTAFSMMIYRAALDEVPPEVTESAKMDGASSFQILRLISLPIIKGSIFTNLMLTTLQTLSVFTLIWVMTTGGPGNKSTTLPIFAYREGFKVEDIGYGNAIAVVMLVLGAVFSIFYVLTLRRAERAEKKS